MERIEDCISFLAGKAGQQVTRRARELLSPHGVTPVQYAMLKVLTGEDGLRGADLGARMLLDSASITGVVDRMESLGLLERRPNTRDRRVQRLYTTEQGRALQVPGRGHGPAECRGRCRRGRKHSRVAQAFKPARRSEELEASGGIKSASARGIAII